jgi:hypothetical protein
MARGMLRGAAVAWGGLIAVQALTSSRGADAASGLLGTVNGLIKRALDPSVPAIPDHSAAAGFTDGDGNYHPNVPDYLGGGTTTAPGSGKKANPKFKVIDPPPTGQHNPAYDGQGGGQLEAYVPGIPSTSSYSA